MTQKSPVTTSCVLFEAQGQRKQSCEGILGSGQKDYSFDDYLTTYLHKFDRKRPLGCAQTVPPRQPESAKTVRFAANEELRNESRALH